MSEKLEKNIVFQKLILLQLKVEKSKRNKEEDRRSEQEIIWKWEDIEMKTPVSKDRTNY